MLMRVVVLFFFFLVIIWLMLCYNGYLWRIFGGIMNNEILEIWSRMCSWEYIIESYEIINGIGVLDVDLLYWRDESVW